MNSYGENQNKKPTRSTLQTIDNKCTKNTTGLNFFGNSLKEKFFMIDPKVPRNNKNKLQSILQS